MKLNKPRTSLIPKLKSNNEGKGVKSITSSALNTKNVYSNAYEKLLEYKKLRNDEVSNNKSEKNDLAQNKTSSRNLLQKTSDVARKMTSDTQVFTKIPVEEEVLCNFENNVRQISEVWLRTSADLSNRLKNLKNNPSLDPVELQQESMKIQMVIQQAKSLTILKTKNVMAEAKMLLQNGETINQEAEFFLNDEVQKTEKESSYSDNTDEPEINKTSSQKLGGMGDLPVKSERTAGYFKEIEDNNFEDENTGGQTTRIDTKESFLFRNKDEVPVTRKDSEQSDYNTLEKISHELMSELSKRNETITLLNNKIFQLQKACEEHLQSRNYLQIKLAECHEKVQWNHVLWKQIGKLKTRIKDFQESYTNLEHEKKALEARIGNQEKEIERVSKLNHLLNQRKLLLSERRRGEEGESKEGMDENCDLERKLRESKILEEKQNAVNVLRMVLNVMKDQENLAQKQIAMFQSKIEELEKTAKI